MNLIGKIFTLLIFFMSICFLVIAVMVGASHRNWKAAAAEAKASADLATTRHQEAKSSTTEQQKLLAAERVSRALQLAQLESELKTARENLVAKEAKLREVIEISQEQLARMEQAEARLAQQDKEVADLKNENVKLVNDIASQFNITRNLTNERFELKNQIQLLTEKRADIVARLAKASRVLTANGLTENSLTDHIVPKLEGVVLRVGAEGLIATSLGSDDGVRVGHTMDIYRGGGLGQATFVGKATVVNTNSDMSALRLEKDFMRDTVQEGDNVTSKF